MLFHAGEGTDPLCAKQAKLQAIENELSAIPPFYENHRVCRIRKTNPQRICLEEAKKDLLEDIDRMLIRREELGIN